MELQKQNIMLERVPLRIKSQAAAEGEISPPGSMPPIDYILSIDGRTTASAEALDNTILVDGAVNLGILYVCSAGLVHGFDSVAIFKHNIDMPGSKAGSRCEINPTVGTIEHKVIDGAVSVRAVVSIDCTQFQREDIPVVSQINDMPLEQKVIDFSSQTINNDIMELNIHEDVRLPRPIEKILGVGGHIRTQSVSKEGDQALIEGILRLSALYVAPDGTLMQTPLVLPFTHYADIDGDATALSAISRFLTLNASQVDEDIISIESNIEISLNSTIAQNYQALSDAYSIGADSIDCIQDQLMLNKNEHVDCRCSVRVNATVPSGLPDVDRVMVARFRPQINKSEAMDASINLEGTLHSSFIYLDRDGGLHGFDAQIPFECMGEAPSFNPDMEISVSAACELIHAGASGDEIPLQVALEISADGYYNDVISVIKSVDHSERAITTFGPMVYFPSKDETLWDVGKRFAISLDDLRELNPDIGEQTPKSVLLNLRKPD